MRKPELEARAREIIDRVKAGQRVEDFEVEVKTSFPRDPTHAARQLAGHANAARGEPVIWLFGIDEDARAIPGVDHTELANWWPSVEGCFEHKRPPRIEIDVNVAVDQDTTVVAICFQTDEAPYVVKNAAYGKVKSVRASLEVPWREGRGTKSAGHAELIRLLVPVQRVPAASVHDPALWFQGNLGVGNREWGFRALVYVVPRSEQVVTIPFHDCRAWFSFPGDTPRTELDRVTLRARPRGKVQSVDESQYDVCLSRPAMLILDGRSCSLRYPPRERPDALVGIRLACVGTPTPRSCRFA